jgi:hypothetical protein
MSNIETAEDEFGASAKKNQPATPLDIAVAKLKPGPALDFAVAALQELKTQAAGQVGDGDGDGGQGRDLLRAETLRRQSRDGRGHDRLQLRL